MSTEGYEATKALLDRLKVQLDDTLSAVPSTRTEVTEFLENHLRAAIAESGEQEVAATVSIDPDSLTAYIDFMKEAVALAHQQKSVTFDNASACHDAGVAGVVIISATTGINPALGVLGFLVSVYLVIDACA